MVHSTSCEHRLRIQPMTWIASMDVFRKNVDRQSLRHEHSKRIGEDITSYKYYMVGVYFALSGCPLLHVYWHSILSASNDFHAVLIFEQSGNVIQKGCDNTCKTTFAPPENFFLG